MDWKPVIKGWPLMAQETILPMNGIDVKKALKDLYTEGFFPPGDGYSLYSIIIPCGRSYARIFISNPYGRKGIPTLKCMVDGTNTEDGELLSKKFLDKYGVKNEN